MSAFLVITFSGIALGAIYFLAASGLSLIYGLMDVLNFAHGLFMTIGAYLGWEIATRLPSSFGAPALITLAIVGATLGGAVAAGITELVLIRPLYGKPISQILVTIGLDLAAVGLLMGGFGSTALQIPVPLWLIEPTRIGSMFLPNANFLALGAGVCRAFGSTRVRVIFFLNAWRSARS